MEKSPRVGKPVISYEQLKIMTMMMTMTMTMVMTMMMRVMTMWLPALNSDGSLTPFPDHNHQFDL